MLEYLRAAKNSLGRRQRQRVGDLELVGEDGGGAREGVVALLDLVDRAAHRRLVRVDQIDGASHLLLRRALEPLHRLLEAVELGELRAARPGAFGGGGGRHERAVAPQGEEVALWCE